MISKLKLLGLLALIMLIGCSDETPVEKKMIINVDDENSSTNARHADGAGTGDPTVPFGSVGNALTWNGDGRWHSDLFGSPVWFFGPSPQQLQNGIRGTWQVTCAYYTPNECYPNGYVVDGDGSLFTVYAPACAGISSSTISFPKLVANYFTINGERRISGYSWTTENITVKTLSGGNCSLQASGKVIVNSDCKPVIVSPNSVVANLCGQAPVLVE